MDVISTMQVWKLVPEAYLVEPGCNLPAVVQSAFADGIRMFVVCGGDGTIDVMAGALAGTNATLRTGQRIKVDIGEGRFGYLLLHRASLPQLS
jgi:hypothetical protein